MALRVQKPFSVLPCLEGFSSKSASQEGSYWQAQRTTAIFDHSFHSVQCLEGRKMLQPVQYGGKTVDFWLLTDSNQANMSNYIDKNVNKSFYPEEKSKCKQILPLFSLFICTIAWPCFPPLLSFLAVSSKHIKPIGDRLHPTGSMKITFTPLFVTHSIFIVWNIWCTQVEALILEDKFRMRRWIFYMQQICQRQQHKGDCVPVALTRTKSQPPVWPTIAAITLSLFYISVINTPSCVLPLIWHKGLLCCA